MNFDDYFLSVSLYVLGEELDPEEATAILGTDPSVARKKGHTWITSTGDTITVKRGVWRLSLDCDSGQVSDHLADLLATVSIDRDTVAKIPGVQKAYFDIFITTGDDQPGDNLCRFGLPADLVAALGKAGLPIYFSVCVSRYPPVPDGTTKGRALTRTQFTMDINLDVLGDHLDPEAVTGALGRTPTLARARGQRRYPTSNRKGVYRTGLWRLTSASQSDLITDHVLSLLSDLSPDRDAIARIAGVEDARIEIALKVGCGQHHSRTFEFELNTETVIALGKAGLPVLVTVRAA